MPRSLRHICQAAILLVVSAVGVPNAIVSGQVRPDAHPAGSDTPAAGGDASATDGTSNGSDAEPNSPDSDNSTSAESQARESSDAPPVVRPRIQADRRLFLGFEDIHKELVELPDSLLRPEVHALGPVTSELLYTGEWFNNARGGLSTADATAYVGNLDLTLTMHFDQLGWEKMGKLVVYGQQHTGPGISGRFTGDAQTLSNLDAENFTQLSAYFWQRSFVDDLISTQLGFQDANSTFCALDTASGFISSSFGLIPTVPLPTFPSPAIGATITVQLTDSITWMVGVFDDRQAGSVGTFRLDPSGQIWLTELQTHGTLFGNDALKREFFAGYWYQTTGRMEIATERYSADNYGFYLAGEQVLTQERDTSDEGLAVFGQFGWAPDTRNDLEFYYGVGVVYHGIIPGRDSDSLGLGLASVQFTDKLVADSGLTYENAIELFYVAQLTPWAQLHPDVQYIANPGGNGRDAIAVGLRYQIQF
ncbi:MAG: carbohydrate porin [Planctomycetales bacterium]|nr:carbohydrate porin [Planctomycetales bacterium]